VKLIVTAIVLLAVVGGAAAWRLVDVKPDPNQQAVADGCQRDTTKIYTGFAPNWVYVNDKDFPASGPAPAPRWAQGIVWSEELPDLAVRIATSDDPLTHRSFDANIDLRVTSNDDFLTGTSRDSTPEQGTIHLERETGAFPLWALPAPGDFVQVEGAWVWDCDHYKERGEKTEIHPWRAFWADRGPDKPSPSSPTGEAEGDVYVSTDGTPAATQSACAHTTKGGATFKDCTHTVGEWGSVNGDYAFAICAPRPRPSAGAQVVARIVDRGSVSAPPVRVVPGANGCATVRFIVAGATGQRVVVAKQVFLGWKRPPAARLPVHLRLHFDSVLIRRAMDPSCAPDQPNCPAKNESTLLGQITSAPGEWQITWSVDGIWRAWSPQTLLAHDGFVFAGRQTVDFWVPRTTPWRLVAEARECDFGAIPSFDGPGHTIAPCPKTTEVGNASGDDYAGQVVVHFRSPAGSLGTHVSNATTTGSSCPPSKVHGCYRLTYTVTRVR
jgi:hypothetical protein